MRYAIRGNRIYADAGLGFVALGQLGQSQYIYTPYRPPQTTTGVQFRCRHCNPQRPPASAHVRPTEQRWPPCSPCPPWPPPGTPYWGPPNEPPTRPCAYSCG